MDHIHTCYMVKIDFRIGVDARIDSFTPPNTFVRTLADGMPGFDQDQLAELGCPVEYTIYIIICQDKSIYRIGESSVGVIRNIEGFKGNYQKLDDYRGQHLTAVHFLDDSLSDAQFRCALQSRLITHYSGQKQVLPGNGQLNEHAKTRKDFEGAYGIGSVKRSAYDQQFDIIKSAIDSAIT